MPCQARLTAARAYLALASFVRIDSPALAQRLIESASRVLEGETPTWDEREELQRGYPAGI